MSRKTIEDKKWKKNKQMAYIREKFIPIQTLCLRVCRNNITTKTIYGWPNKIVQNFVPTSSNSVFCCKIPLDGNFLSNENLL